MVAPFNARKGNRLRSLPRGRESEVPVPDLVFPLTSRSLVTERARVLAGTISVFKDVHPY